MAQDLKIRKEKIEEVYDVKEELGRGQFAVVKRCVSKNTQEPVAAKFVKVKKTKASRNGLSREMIEREAGILSMLSHERVLKLHDVFDLGVEMCLVLELLSGGELFDKISEQEFLTEGEAGCYMKQVLEAMAYLHEKFIVHLDIKPENIVLKDKDKSDIKLVDFGLAQMIKPGDEVREMMGTPEFVAPEVVNFDCIGLYTDMWAIGVLAYILLSGCSPFLGDDNQETYANIVAVDYHFDEEYFDSISDDAKLFVEELLKKNPSKRNTAQDCLDHPWIRSISSPRLRLESSVIQTARFKTFQARRRWQQTFQKMKAITRFSRFLKIKSATEETMVNGDNKVSSPVTEPSPAPPALATDPLPATDANAEAGVVKCEETTEADLPTKETTSENKKNEIPADETKKSHLSIPDILTEDMDEDFPRSPMGTPNMKRRYSRSESPVHYTELLNQISVDQSESHELTPPATMDDLESMQGKASPITSTNEPEPEEVEEEHQPHSNPQTLAVDVLVASKLCNEEKTAEPSDNPIDARNDEQVADELVADETVDDADVSLPVLNIQKENQSEANITSNNIQDIPKEIENEQKFIDEYTGLEETENQDDKKNESITSIKDEIPTVITNVKNDNKEEPSCDVKQETDNKNINESSQIESSPSSPLLSDNVFSDFSNIKAFDIRDTKSCRISGRRSKVFKDEKQEKNNINRRSASLSEQRRSFILGERSLSVGSSLKKESDTTKDETTDSPSTDEQQGHSDVESEPCIGIVAEDVTDVKEQEEEKTDEKDNVQPEANGNLPLDENENVNEEKDDAPIKVTLSSNIENNHKKPLLEIDEVKRKKKKGCGRCMVM